jgi:ABC-type phosphate transport system permease subunit
MEKWCAMVVRMANQNPNPSFKHQFKWHAITILLTVIRFTNVFTCVSKKESLTEAVGRTGGWWSLLLNKPKIR